jgi:hypothetical protein
MTYSHKTPSTHCSPQEHAQQTEALPALWGVLMYSPASVHCSPQECAQQTETCCLLSLHPLLHLPAILGRPSHKSTITGSNTRKQGGRSFSFRRTRWYYHPLKNFCLLQHTGTFFMPQICEEHKSTSDPQSTTTVP